MYPYLVFPATRAISEIFFRYALNGVLNNFASRDDGISGGVALREQAWKLRHNEKISPKWREWLEKLNTDTWKHPEDIM